MEQRNTQRYTFTDILLHEQQISEISCSFDFDPDVRGRVVDISLTGFGIEIRNLTGIQAEKLETLNTYLITLAFGTDSLMAGVKSIWKKMMFEGGYMIFKQGVLIDLISPEDRLSLSGVIEKIRAQR
jgi:hypothetical protein